jgi:cytosine/creatinine deaminase
MGVDVVGGIPHFERTMEDGAASVRELCQIAADRGLLVDMHCDETDDPQSRHIETLAKHKGWACRGGSPAQPSDLDAFDGQLLCLETSAADGRGAGCRHSQSADQHRAAGPPRYLSQARGLTRVKEMQALGITVGWGQDCVLDPWYPLGTADMLDVAFMGLHVAQMTSPAEMRRCFDMVTAQNAASWGFPTWG